MKIQTNTAANSALGYMKVNAQATERSIQKLSSGFRINRAADDAAGLAIANQLRADSKTLGQAQKNAAQASSMLQIADGASQTLGNIFDRMRELASQGASANIGGQGGKLQDEWNSLYSEADRIIKGTSYQGQNVLTALTAKTNQSAAAGTAALASTATTAQTGSVTSIAGSVSTTNAQNGKYTLAQSGSNLVMTRVSDGTTESISGTAVSGKLTFATLGVDITTASGYSAAGAVSAVAGTAGTFSDSTVSAVSGITAPGASTPSNMPDATYTVKDGTGAAAGKLELWNGSTKVATSNATVSNGATSVAFDNGASLTLSAGFTAAAAAVGATAGTATGGGAASGANGLATATSVSTAVNGTYTFSSTADGSVTLDDGAGHTQTLNGATDGVQTLNFSSLGISIDTNSSFVTKASATAGAAAGSGNASITSAANVTTGAAQNGSYDIVETSAGNFKLQQGGVDVAGATATAATAGAQTITFGNGLSIDVDGTFDGTTTGQLTGGQITVSGGTDAAAMSLATGTITVAGANAGSGAVASSADTDTFVVSGSVAPVAAGANTLDGATINVTGGVQAQTASNAPTILVGTSASQGTGSYATNDSVSLDLGTLQDNAILNLSASGNFEAGGNTTGVDLTTTAGSQDALTRLDSALGSLNTFVGKLGAAESRLDYASQNIDSMLQNTQAAESSIRDADMAQEMSSFTKSNILQQAAQSMLAQANQGTQGILQLLRG